MINEELQEKFEQLASTIDWIKTKIVDLQEEKGLAPIKAPYEVEVPEDIDDYYTTGIYGRVDRLENFSAPYKENCYKRGLTFKTREQAEQHDKELILLFKMHKWAEEHNGGWIPNWKESDNKFFICYFHNSGSFHVKDTWHVNAFHKLPYFKSEKIANQFIDEFGEEIKEVF